jgi:hypothetical protein
MSEEKQRDPEHQSHTKAGDKRPLLFALHPLLSGNRVFLRPDLRDGISHPFDRNAERPHVRYSREELHRPGLRGQGSAFPTRATHEAHVIPSRGSSVLCTGTSYPESRIAETRLAILVLSGSAVTVAVLVARLTEAKETPSTRERLFSTRATQEAQVMPPTGKVHFSSLPEFPPEGETDVSGGT